MGVAQKLRLRWHQPRKGPVVPRFCQLPTILSAAVLTVTLTTPALAASGSVALPEPSALLLLSMGVTGVAIGRRFSSKRPRD